MYASSFRLWDPVRPKVICYSLVKHAPPITDHTTVRSTPAVNTPPHLSHAPKPTPKQGGILPAPTFKRSDSRKKSVLA